MHSDRLHARLYWFRAPQLRQGLEQVDGASEGLQGLGAFPRLLLDPADVVIRLRQIDAAEPVLGVLLDHLFEHRPGLLGHGQRLDRLVAMPVQVAEHVVRLPSPSR